MRLEKSDLLRHALDALAQAGLSIAFWGDPNEHPYRLVLTSGSDSCRILLYIWNITHGGKNRSADEYRIQVTGVESIDLLPGTTTLILGYYEGTNVFAGWDATRHAGKVSFSPSLQVREDHLLAANLNGVSLYPKSNEVVVVCSPPFLAEYVFSAAQMHGYITTDIQKAVQEFVVAEPEEDLPEPEIPEERKKVIRTQAQLHRAYDFRRRVLAAYQNTCAVSAMQMRLVDAAHILPVNTPGSHDGTSNGLCLDALYHRAFDQGLLVILPEYTIGLDMSRLDRLAEVRLSGGFERFLGGLRDAIDLPASRRDRPNPEMLKQALAARSVDVAKVRLVSDLRA